MATRAKSKPAKRSASKAASIRAQKPVDKNEQMAAEAQQEKEGEMSERQALAGALIAFDAEPNASINKRKRLGPSSGSLCKRSRASSSDGDIS